MNITQFSQAKNLLQNHANDFASKTAQTMSILQHKWTNNTTTAFEVHVITMLIIDQLVYQKNQKIYQASKGGITASIIEIDDTITAKLYYSNNEIKVTL